MKLCLLANAESIHTQRWATYFSQNGHSVTVLSLSKGNIPGVTVRCVGPEPGVYGRLAYLAAVLPVRIALKALKPDVLHAHYAGGYGLLGALADYHPLIISAWGSDVLVVPRAEPLMKRIILKCLERADLITSVAAHMTASIRALGVTKEILTLPLGVDTEIFCPRPAASPRTETSPLIVSTRHLEEVYNLSLLVDALPEILLAVPSARVVIIGDGSMRNRLEMHAHRLGVEHSILFLGRVTPQEVASYLVRADVFVSTSLSDGNNISLNEAMACGAFPVVTDISANREWIQNGVNGYLVDAHDPCDLATQVVGALRTPELRSRAAARNWEIIRERASWKAAMETMEQRYQVIVNGGGQGGQATGIFEYRTANKNNTIYSLKHDGIYEVYRFCKKTATSVDLPEGYEVAIWQPGLRSMVPPTMSPRFLAWWVFSYCGIMKSKLYRGLLITQNGEVVHRSCLVPKYFRWPFMADGDLQITSTWTKPAHRGQGLAKFGLKYLVDRFASDDRTLWYLTRQDNPASIAVCNSCSFELVARACRSRRWGSLLLGKFALLDDRSWK